MDFSHGILLFVIGCTVTLMGFFMVFLVINYNQKKELKDGPGIFEPDEDL